MSNIIYNFYTIYNYFYNLYNITEGATQMTDHHTRYTLPYDINIYIGMDFIIFQCKKTWSLGHFVTITLSHGTDSLPFP